MENNFDTLNTKNKLKKALIFNFFLHVNHRKGSLGESVGKYFVLLNKLCNQKAEKKSKLNEFKK